MTTLPDTTTEKGQREASVMLAELCGWDVRFGLIDSDQSWDGFAHDTLTITANDGEWCGNLYDPAHMGLAWRVLNWWEWVKSEEGGGLSEKTFFVGFGDFEAWMKMLPAEALRRWLDKILSLAVKEGMI